MQRKIFLGILLAMVLTVAFGAACGEGALYAYAANETPLYQSADSASPVQGAIAADSWITVLEKGAGFCQVTLQDGTQGFVAADAVALADPDVASQGVVTNDGKYVNLREKASLHGKVLKKVNDGTAVAITSHQSGWFGVTAEGTAGFMADTMITVGPKAACFKYIHDNNGRTVNFRSAPVKEDSNIMDQLKEGTELDVLIKGKDFDWVRIGGKLGFVSTVFTADRDENEKIPLSYTYGYVVLNDPTSVLHVRAGEDLSSKVLGVYHIGTKMQILSQDDHFAEVQVGKVHGYVQAKYLKAQKKYYDKPNQQPQYNSDGWIEAILINPNGGDKVNFRDNPSMQSKVISQQSIGVEAQVYSKGKDFSKVRLGGEWGYIRTDFLWFK